MLSCLHEFNRNWEFGPIIVEPDNKTAKHWFYRKCKKCGFIELFSANKDYSIINYLESTKFSNIFTESRKDSVLGTIQLFPRINLDNYR